jgi:hypothetical protein
MDSPRGDAEARFNTAVRAARPLWRGGCWLRAGLLAAIWGTLAFAAPGELPRGVALLLPGTAAVLLAFAHTSADTLDGLRMLPGARQLVGHLSGTSGRATVDVPGLAEGTGALLASWLYVGPFPLPSLPPWVRTLGIVLVVAYVWDAVFQAVVDPGWYNPTDPPPLGMRIFRPTIPLILAGIFLFDLWPYTAVSAQVPPAVHALLTASPLAYYPVWAAFDVLLAASAWYAAVARRQSRREVGGDLHSFVKNPVSILHRYVTAEDPGLDQVRELSHAALLMVEELRQDLLSARPAVPGPRSFGELWSVLAVLLPADGRVCAVEPGALAVALPPADYQLARRILPDLLSNALRAGASRVLVDCRVLATGQGHRVQIEVRDDGPGPPPAFLDKPMSSLAVLRTRLDRLGGELAWQRRDGLTSAVAGWPRQGSTIRWSTTPTGSGQGE